MTDICHFSRVRTALSSDTNMADENDAGSGSVSAPIVSIVQKGHSDCGANRNGLRFGSASRAAQPCPRERDSPLLIVEKNSLGKKCRVASGGAIRDNRTRLGVYLFLTSSHLAKHLENR
jgi:hypothetical protein